VLELMRRTRESNGDDDELALLWPPLPLSLSSRTLLCSMQGPDPLAHLACSSCRTPLSASTASPSSLNLDSLSSLAPCGHILCSPCTASATQGAHGTGAPPLCPVCGTPGLVPRDQATADVLDCFRPLPDLAQELGTAAGWQTTHLAEQLDYFKAKCAQQKDVLARVGNELKKVKALKQCVLLPLLPLDDFKETWN